MKNQEDCDGLEPQRCEHIKAIVLPGIDYVFGLLRNRPKATSPKNLELVILVKKLVIPVKNTSQKTCNTSQKH